MPCHILRGYNLNCILTKIWYGDRVVGDKETVTQSDIKITDF